jgi:hypothetical protein
MLWWDLIGLLDRNEGEVRIENPGLGRQISLQMDFFVSIRLQFQTISLLFADRESSSFEHGDSESTNPHEYDSRVV